jgi:hypothetical protein
MGGYLIHLTSLISGDISLEGSPPGWGSFEGDKPFYNRFPPPDAPFVRLPGVPVTETFRGLPHVSGRFPFFSYDTFSGASVRNRFNSSQGINNSILMWYNVVGVKSPFLHKNHGNTIPEDVHGHN